MKNIYFYFKCCVIILFIIGFIVVDNFCVIFKIVSVICFLVNGIVDILIIIFVGNKIVVLIFCIKWEKIRKLFVLVKV